MACFVARFFAGLLVYFSLAAAFVFVEEIACSFVGRFVLSEVDEVNAVLIAGNLLQ